MSVSRCDVEAMWCECAECFYHSKLLCSVLLGGHCIDWLDSGGHLGYVQGG